MAKYLSPEARKKRARRRNARKLAMYASLAVFVLVLSYGIVALIEAFTPDDEPQPELLQPTPAGDMQPNTEVEKDSYITITINHFIV